MGKGSSKQASNQAPGSKRVDVQGRSGHTNGIEVFLLGQWM
jgi:hypothetical protein